MTLKTRRLIFYAFCFLFILIGAGIVMYSQGWRIYAENCPENLRKAKFEDGFSRIPYVRNINSVQSPNSEINGIAPTVAAHSIRGQLRDEIKKIINCEVKFQKTGAIYIETEPKSVSIKIDKIISPDKTGIIQKGTLFPNLTPKNYKVEIIKDGYLPYRKNLAVKPSIVTELLDVILIPREIDRKTAINPEIKGDTPISQSNDDKKIIIKDDKRGIYRLYDFNNLSSILNLNVAFNNSLGVTQDESKNINWIVFHPFNSSSFIIGGKNGIYILDTVRLKSENIIHPLPKIWTINNPNIYYIKETGNYGLFSFNLVVKTETNLVPLPADVGKIIKVGVSENQNKIALLNTLNDLYIFNQSDKTLVKIAHNAKDSTFSPDNKKIAFLDKDGLVSIHFLEDCRKGINKKTGDVIRFNLENKSSIKNISWHKDSYHLFAEYPDGMEFMEIDDKPPLNTYNIISGNFHAFYNQKENKLYYIQQKSLYFIQI